MSTYWACRLVADPARPTAISWLSSLAEPGNTLVNPGPRLADPGRNLLDFQFIPRDTRCTSLQDLRILAVPCLLDSWPGLADPGHTLLEAKLLNVTQNCLKV